MKRIIKYQPDCSKMLRTLSELSELMRSDIQLVAALRDFIDTGGYLFVIQVDKVPTGSGTAFKERIRYEPSDGLLSMMSASRAANWKHGAGFDVVAHNKDSTSLGGEVNNE